MDDLASAAVHLLEHYDSPQTINVGVGEDLSIAELAAKIAAVVGYEGRVTYDTSKPDGTPRKLLDVSRINALGWRATTTLDAGLAATYDWYLAHLEALRSS